MRVLVAFLMILPLLAQGQGETSVADGKLTYYLTAYGRTDGSQADGRDVYEFAERMKVTQASARNEKEFLSQLFSKTHRKFLKSYTDYVSFGETLRKGTYNCLTGTALYALLLDQLGVEYRIIETNYHIFLLAGSGDERALIEATDPLNGFITGSARIAERISEYRKNEVERSGPSKQYYRYSTELFNDVNLDELLGLLHYNLSVVAYNRRDLPEAIDQLSEAMPLYRSPRIDEFARLVHLMVIESKLEPSVKAHCLSEIEKLRSQQVNLTAQTN
jgi:hypothetical protein